MNKLVRDLSRAEVEELARGALPGCLRHIHLRPDGGFQAYWTYRGYTLNVGISGDLELWEHNPAATLRLVLDSNVTVQKREINARLGRPQNPPEWLTTIMENLRDDMWVCWGCEKAHSRGMKRISDGKCYICHADLDHILYRGR